MRGWIGIAALPLAACAAPGEKADEMKWKTLNGAPPLVIAHRGASGYLPEHTLEAYKRAIEMGADIVEPDLVFTKDGVLVARHDRYLSATTDVADHPEFASRKRANDDPNDAPREDWWVEDFTLAELKTLRARQPFPGRSKELDGLYDIPTFAEMLELVAAEAARAGRPVGVYPETKHPGFFASIGHDFEAPLLAAFEGFDAGPVFIQSFEPEILKRLKGKTDAKLVQLVYEEAPGAGPNIPLDEIATYADGVGPAKAIAIGDCAKDPQAAAYVMEAHQRGLLVHPWTFRREDSTIMFVAGSVTSPESLSTSSEAISDPASGAEEVASALEISMAFNCRVDGVFTDFPDIAVRVRDAMSRPVSAPLP